MIERSRHNLSLTQEDFTLAQKLFDKCTPAAKPSQEVLNRCMQLLDSLVLPELDAFASSSSLLQSTKAARIALLEHVKHNWPAQAGYISNVLVYARRIASFSHCHTSCLKCTDNYKAFIANLSKVRAHAMASNRLDEWSRLFQAIYHLHMQRKGLWAAIQAWEAQQPRNCDKTTWYHKLQAKR
jgi:hypothetical protein